MRVSLRHFRFFVAVAETGQVSKAAAALFTSQPAVTEAIKTLETDMGVKLFNRSPKGVTLTYEGAIFLQHAQTVLAAAVDAMLAPQQVQRDMAGQMTLACTHTVAGYFVTPLLSRFRRIFPGIEVNLVEFERPEIERRVLSGEVDLAVCLLSPLESGDRIETELLVRSKRRLWLPANHALLDRKSISLRDIQAEPYIMLAVDDAEETTLSYFRNAGLEPNVVFRTTSMEAIRNVVAEGSDTVPSMDIGLVWSRSAGLSRDAKVFVDVCRSGSGILGGIVYDEPQ